MILALVQNIQHFISLFVNCLLNATLVTIRAQKSKLFSNYSECLSQKVISLFISSSENPGIRTSKCVFSIFSSLWMRRVTRANVLRSGPHMRSFIRAWLSVFGSLYVHQGAFTCAAKRLNVCRLFLFKCLLDIITPS
jgi:hypothetical protein